MLKCITPHNANCIISTIIHQISTIFKTIDDETSLSGDDETSLSGQKIVSVLQARKIAQKQAIKQTNLDIQCLKNYEAACKNGTVTSEDFTRIMGKASSQAQDYSKNIKDGTGSAQVYADKQKTLQQSIKNTGTASQVAAIGVKALSIAGNMLAGIAISFAISKVIEGIEYLATVSERAIEKTKELQEEISQISSDYQSERQTLEGLKDEYDSLTAKIGENGAEAALSADEYERYRDITSEILGITPKLITGWDDEGRAISNKNGLLQQSIDLLDEEYQKKLRNSTTKSKNEEIAAGIIESKRDFDTSGDTKTVGGTRWDLVYKDFYSYFKTAFSEAHKNGDLANEWQLATLINEFVFGEELTNTDRGISQSWLSLLQKNITSSKENFETFVNSLSNEDNPIYQFFTDEQIDELIRDGDEYFQELARIESEEQQYYQQYKDQLNLNAQAVGDAYNGLSDETKAGITQMIDSFDYSDMTKDKFSDMAIDLKDFVGKLSTDDTLLSYFNNLFKPMGEDESIEDYEKRVKTGIDNITSYCETNYPAIKLSFGDVESDIEDLKAKYNAAIARFTGESNDADLEKFFEDNSINDESEIDYFNKVTEGAKTASEAIEMYNKVKSDTFNNETTISFFDELGNKIEYTVEEFGKLFDLADSDKAFDGVVNSAKEYATVLDSLENRINAVSSAMQEQNENGSISAKTALSLIETDKDYAKALEFSEQGIRLNADATKVLTKKKIQAAIVEATQNMQAYQTKEETHNKADHLRQQIVLSSMSQKTPGLIATPSMSIEDINSEITSLQERWQEANKIVKENIDIDIEAQQGYIESLQKLYEEIDKEGFTTDKNKDPLELDKDTNIYNWKDAWLKDQQEQVDNLKEELEKINSNFQKAVELGDEEQIKILSKSYQDKAKEIQNLTSNIATAGRLKIPELLNDIYAIAPELKGKINDGISEQDMLAVEKRLNGVYTAQVNIGKEMEYNNSNLKNANKDNIDKAQENINLFKELATTYEEYLDAVGHTSGEGTFAETWSEQSDNILQSAKDTFTSLNDLFNEEIEDLQNDVDKLDFRLELLDDDAYGERMDIIAEKMKINNQISENYAQQLQKIQDEYSDGLISNTDEYIQAVEELENQHQEAIKTNKEYADSLKDIAQQQIDLAVQVEDDTKSELETYLSNYEDGLRVV